MEYDTGNVHHTINKDHLINYKSEDNLINYKNKDDTANRKWPAKICGFPVM